MLKKIMVKGIVQGVGFRPFVYRIAKDNSLRGYVKNMGNYVEIVVIGNKTNINAFLDDLMNKKPPLAKINEIKVFDEVDESLYKYYMDYYNDFIIEKSQENNENNEEGTIPPDIAICEDCLKEIMDKNDRRYKYPFTACTNCGARFTIVKELPYDRDNTSMDKFPLCEDCLNEYKNPLDRRFHAQATCCPKCGPKVFLTDKNGKILCEKEDVIENTVNLLKEGHIIAIKGVGGTHLACCCDNDEVVLNLRNKLNRPTQPFAIMTKLEYLDLFATFDDDELNLLKSSKRPIVVLEKNKDYNKYFSKYVSNLNTIGVMLPYSALHYLLFDNTDKIAYIMTSANLPGLPMSIKNKDILNNLKDIADYFLLHNREIINRCDDSVLKKINNRMIFLRRSRGYVPEPIIVNNSLIKNNNKNILCVGPELNSTACLVKGNKFYLTQYIGNTSKYETFNYLNDAIYNILRLTNTNKLDAVVSDLHPSYNSTKLAYELAEKFDTELYKLQHHKAHAYALMGDNDIFEDAIFITVDGLGYGEDGNIWGGEILKYRYDYDDKNNNGNKNYKNDKYIKRVGHLEEQYQTGGDLSAKYPLRMLFSILYKRLNSDELIEFIKKYNFFSDKDLKLMLFQLDKKINVIKTTSCGRILDSISALLSITNKRTYDGEYAIRMESVAESYIKKHPDDYTKCLKMAKNDIEIKNNILNTTDLVYNCYNMLLNGFKKGFIAYYIHLAIAEGLSEIAMKNAELYDIKYIGLTGGVSYNKIISERIRENVEDNGFKFLYHKQVPNGDGGISFGQGIGYILNSRC
ncbi:carbamoyltransferase HypF [Methanothermococcus okinawensis]|uniref:Carbamoyltransferase n=1 Tax=Methanothermococcus okinawensis (strain DSM 14208 / JCM 11175 / IH1) TaxID=647113 RepID=F8AKV5_METOI|nr:(NiFe) hydrogenase maturation protein HypF [Methanothermococcus okinawensis IH1]